MVGVLKDLITRLLAATAPDRALDEEIALAAGWQCMRDWLGQWWRPPGGTFATSVSRVPRFTGCMEDALKLLPPSTETQKYGATVWVMPDGTGRARVWCQVKDDSAEGGWATDVVPGNPGLPENKGATPALAVCVAALRARATEGTP